MAKVIGYSGRELPVDESVYDDNRTLLDKDVTEQRFKANMYSLLTLEQQNEIREMVGLPPFKEGEQNMRPVQKFAGVLKSEPAKKKKSLPRHHPNLAKE